MDGGTPTGVRGHIKNRLYLMGAEYKNRAIRSSLKKAETSHRDKHERSGIEC